MSDLSGSKTEQVFRSGTISNVDSANLTADVTVGGTLYEDVEIHYHCDADATVHGAPFSDNDNVVVIFNFDTELPVAIVGFVVSPRTCGNILIELDDGTKEIYDIASNTFTSYVGSVTNGTRYFFCFPTDTGCDNGFQRDGTDTSSSVIDGEECPPGSEVFLSETTNTYDVDYSSDYGSISDFLTATKTNLSENCINCGGSGSAYGNDIHNTANAHKGNVWFSLPSPYSQVEPIGAEDFTKRPSVVNNSIIEKFLVLSYASDRDYSNDVVNDPSCNTTQTVVWDWEDYVLFCENGVCTEFANTSDSTTNGLERYEYAIEDFYVYIQQDLLYREMLFLRLVIMD
jgi:hypothetical protein